MKCDQPKEEETNIRSKSCYWKSFVSDIADFKVAIINMLEELNETWLKDVEEAVVTTPFEIDISERKNKEEMFQKNM